MHQILEQFQPAPRAMNILFLSISQRKIVAKPNLVLLTLQHFSPNDATLNGILHAEKPQSAAVLVRSTLSLLNSQAFLLASWHLQVVYNA